MSSDAAVRGAPAFLDAEQAMPETVSIMPEGGRPPADRAAVPETVSLRLAENIANAVLYEGYILYPYRPSSVKNRQRWTFGGVYPQAYSRAHGGSDAELTQTECLITGEPLATLGVKLRFLHLTSREIRVLPAPAAEWQAETEAALQLVPSLRVNGTVYHTWQEAEERVFEPAPIDLGGLANEPRTYRFSFPAMREAEPLRGADQLVTGVMIRRQLALAGLLELSAQQLGAGAYRLTLRIRNVTPCADALQQTRDEALLSSFVSTHAILSTRGGAFISQIDPPEEYRASAEACRSIGTYPVLVGAAGDCSLMLSSPIILYDYPQIAPESPGDLFDGTEIDEILTLRILTMTGEEKAEMRQADERGRALLERTESMSPEVFMRLHGVLRGLQPLAPDAGPLEHL